MDDKSIRKILIAYLKAVSKEVRIFEEKSIGNSICDVMAVTDLLIGYEIKSDLDNYQRLERQIQAYFQTKKNREHVDALDLDAEFKKLKCFTAELAPEKLDSAGQEKTLISVLDFSVICPAKQPEDKPYVLLERNGVRYMIQTGKSAAGNLRRLANFFRKFETMVKRDAVTVTRLKERRRNIENQGAIPDRYSQQVAECEKEIEQLRAQIVVA